MPKARSYFRFKKPIRDVAAATLRKTLDGQDKSVVMRTIILNERDFPSVDYERDLRDFWYTSVKPVLERLGVLEPEDSTEEGLTRWDAKLSIYLAELVRSGETTYKDMGLVDQSRRRENPKDQYRVAGLEVYGYKVTVALYPNVILVTEKDTAYGRVEQMAAVLGCACLSAKGQNSLGAMEDLLRGVDPEKDVHILCLTDYDPPGFSIADNIVRQAEDLREALGLKGKIIGKRIGLDLDQLTPEEIEANKFTPKLQKGLRDDWLAAGYGIDGEAKGVELNALPPDRFRRIFTDALRDTIDPAVYKEFLPDAHRRRVALEALRPGVEALLARIMVQVTATVTVDDFDALDLAAQGFNEIPVADLCHGGEKETKRLAVAALKEVAGK